MRLLAALIAVTAYAHTAAPAAHVVHRTALEQPIVVEINRIRRVHSLRPLDPSSELTTAARAHASALGVSGQFRHTWPDGTAFYLWMRRFYPYGDSVTWSVGENLLWSARAIDARQAVALWLESPPHRRILLGAIWRQVGVGAVEADSAPGAYAGQTVVIVSATFGARIP